MSIPYADIVIIALVAGFILLRLRSILGEDVGFDGKSDAPHHPRDVTSDGEETDEPTVLPIRSGEELKKRLEEELKPDVAYEQLSMEKQDIVSEMKKYEPSFKLDRFMEGAKFAFEMVFKAFQENDKETLKHLLADDIEDLFVAEAEANHKADPRTETTLISITETEITDMDLNGKRAEITVRFVSEQIAVERDKEGKIVGGDASLVNQVEDVWTFERELGARNPNWTITAT